jgi:AcrR family transcriptional regulator
MIKNTPPKTSTAANRIVLTAHNLFYQEGIRATGIDKIIAQAGVTKTTFYRHFPSKNDLIKAYLDYRHQLWMTWFVDALQRHQQAVTVPIMSIIPTLAEWFEQDNYRGCAFINALVELDMALPEMSSIVAEHKQAMIDVIATLLVPSDQQQAQAIATLIDGAIIRAQLDKKTEVALQSLSLCLAALCATDEATQSTQKELK